MDQAAPQAAGGPLGAMSENELLERAAAAMARAIAAGAGTLGWSVQWAAYDTVMGELDRRAIALAAVTTPERLAGMRAMLAAAGLGVRA
jgi:hypothetical protein